MYRESGYRIRTARAHKGISQGELADKAGVSRATISRIEEFGLGNCCVVTAKAVADVLGVTVGYLIGEPYYGGLPEKDNQPVC